MSEPANPGVPPARRPRRSRNGAHIVAARKAVYGPVWKDDWIPSPSNLLEWSDRLAGRWRARVLELRDEGVMSYSAESAVRSAIRCPPFDVAMPTARWLCNRWFCPLCHGRFVAAACRLLLKVADRGGTRLWWHAWNSRVVEVAGELIPFIDTPYRRVNMRDDAPGRVVAGYTLRVPVRVRLPDSAYNEWGWAIRTSFVALVEPFPEVPPSGRKRGRPRSHTPIGESIPMVRRDLLRYVAAALRYPAWVLTSKPGQATDMINVWFRVRSRDAIGAARSVTADGASNPSANRTEACTRALEALLSLIEKATAVGFNSGADFMADVRIQAADMLGRIQLRGRASEAQLAAVNNWLKAARVVAEDRATVQAPKRTVDRDFS